MAADEELCRWRNYRVENIIQFYLFFRMAEHNNEYERNNDLKSMPFFAFPHHWQISICLRFKIGIQWIGKRRIFGGFRMAVNV